MPSSSISSRKSSRKSSSKLTKSSRNSSPKFQKSVILASLELNNIPKFVNAPIIPDLPIPIFNKKQMSPLGNKDNNNPYELKVSALQTLKEALIRGDTLLRKGLFDAPLRKEINYTVPNLDAMMYNTLEYGHSLQYTQSFIDRAYSLFRDSNPNPRKMNPKERAFITAAYTPEQVDDSGNPIVINDDDPNSVWCAARPSILWPHLNKNKHIHNNLAPRPEPNMKTKIQQLKYKSANIIWNEQTILAAKKALKNGAEEAKTKAEKKLSKLQKYNNKTKKLQKNLNNLNNKTLSRNNREMEHLKIKKRNIALEKEQGFISRTNSIFNINGVSIPGFKDVQVEIAKFHRNKKYIEEIVFWKPDNDNDCIPEDIGTIKLDPNFKNKDEWLKYHWMGPFPVVGGYMTIDSYEIVTNIIILFDWLGNLFNKFKQSPKNTKELSKEFWTVILESSVGYSGGFSWYKSATKGETEKRYDDWPLNNLGLKENLPDNLVPFDKIYAEALTKSTTSKPMKTEDLIKYFGSYYNSWQTSKDSITYGDVIFSKILEFGSGPCCPTDLTCHWPREVWVLYRTLQALEKDTNKKDIEDANVNIFIDSILKQSDDKSFQTIYNRIKYPENKIIDRRPEHAGRLGNIQAGV